MQEEEFLAHLKNRVCALYPKNEWSKKEIFLLSEISKRPCVLDELADIERLYSRSKFRRKSLKLFLQNWTVELDRSHNQTRNSYYTIYSWMPSKLKISGVELSVFAIIYGYTQRAGYYVLDFNYISFMTGANKEHIKYCIFSLLEKGYIEKIKLDVPESIFGLRSKTFMQ